MKEIATIGNNDPSINFIDRPTVKVIIIRDDKILILNNGLLPGGGIDRGEDFITAIERELQEELGAQVKHIKEIGYVNQYRTFLQKRYIVYGFIAELENFELTTNPQDEGEKNFTTAWMNIPDAVNTINDSIKEIQIEHPILKGDSIQGKIYNLMTSLALIKAIK